MATFSLEKDHFKYLKYGRGVGHFIAVSYAVEKNLGTATSRTLYKILMLQNLARDAVGVERHFLLSM
jgi:hypothetical protein